jgi:hypothetical protein
MAYGFVGLSEGAYGWPETSPLDGVACCSDSVPVRLHGFWPILRWTTSSCVPKSLFARQIIEVLAFYRLLRFCLACNIKPKKADLL